jgi:hypothetical protein
MLPMLDIACERLAHMLFRVLDIAKLSLDSRCGGGWDALRMYESFHVTLEVRVKPDLWLPHPRSASMILDRD